MDYEIEQKTNELIEAIRNSSLYNRYNASLAELEKHPGLFERLMDLRAQTMDLYEHAMEEELIEGSERLAEQYEELQKLPEVNEFLECEEELAKVLKIVSGDVLAAMEMRMPDFEPLKQFG